MPDAARPLSQACTSTATPTESILAKFTQSALSEAPICVPEVYLYQCTPWSTYGILHPSHVHTLPREAQTMPPKQRTSRPQTKKSTPKARTRGPRAVPEAAPSPETDAPARAIPARVSRRKSDTVSD